MLRRLRIVALWIGFLISCAVIAENSMGSIEGIWLSADGTGWIEIEVGPDGPIGRIAGSPDDPDKERPSDVDELNPDPALRQRPLMGLTIMEGFTAGGDGKWKNGKIYDPNSGKTYKCKLTQIDSDTLELRGYIGISLLGRTEKWTRKK